MAFSDYEDCKKYGDLTFDEFGRNNAIKLKI